MVTMIIDSCCQQIALVSRGAGLRTQKHSMGFYNKNNSISNNNHSAYIHVDGSHTIMFDLRHGWRVSHNVTSAYIDQLY